MEIKSVAMCEAQWCSPTSNGKTRGKAALVDRTACQTECQGVRGALSDCIGKVVTSYLHALGMEKDGEMMRVVEIAGSRN